MSRLDMNDILGIIVMLTVVYRVMMIIDFFNDPSQLLLSYLSSVNELWILKGMFKSLYKLCQDMEISNVDSEFTLTKKNIQLILQDNPDTRKILEQKTGISTLENQTNYFIYLYSFIQKTF